MSDTKKSKSIIQQKIEEGATVEQLKNETSCYCPLPWVHLHISTIGEVLPCCISEWGQAPLGNINNNSFDEIWNGEEMRQFRLKMLNDKPDARCKVCYEKEKTGNWSLRYAEIRKRHHDAKTYILNTEEDGSSLDSKPIYWDIRFSNICNMRCRMCGHFSSSRWFADAKAIREQYGNYNYSVSEPHTNQAIIHGVEDSTALLDRLDEYIPYVKEFYFAGGEPLIMEEHYRILKRLDELELYNVYIRYNTNFMQMHYKDLDVIEMWKKFKNVHVAASIDASGARAELIRKDTVWATIERNVERLAKDAPNVHFEVSPTLQILNILTISDLHREWVEKGYMKPELMFFNILVNPPYYNLKALPMELKEQAKEKLEQHVEWIENRTEMFPGKFKETVNNTINFMMSEQLPEKELYSMVDQTTKLDIIRDENTPSTFPELDLIWKNYGN